MSLKSSVGQVHKERGDMAFKIEAKCRSQGFMHVSA